MGKRRVGGKHIVKGKAESQGARGFDQPSVFIPSSPDIY
jgi:hypothetical protein